MELSPFTMQVLKNFASINSNIVIHEGSTIRTMAEAKNILGHANVSEVFPQAFGIYDLSEFLSVIGLVDTPRIRFEDSYALIGDSSGRTQIKYFFSDTSMLTTPTKQIAEPDADVSFVLDQNTLNSLKRSASVLGHSEVSVTGKNNIITLTVMDKDNSTSNTYSIDVDGDYNSDNFNFIININNLKMIAGDYNVRFSSKLISQFTHTTHDLRYWVALEKTSTYQ
jgi:hypothetical protein